MTLYDEMNAAGLVIGSWQSDLYVKDTPQAWEIYAKYKDSISRPQRFISNTGEGPCLDFALCYKPYWDEVNRKVEARAAAKGGA